MMRSFSSGPSRSLCIRSICFAQAPSTYRDASNTNRSGVRRAEPWRWFLYMGGLNRPNMARSGVNSTALTFPHEKLLLLNQTLPRNPTSFSRSSAAVGLSRPWWLPWHGWRLLRYPTVPRPISLLFVVLGTLLEIIVVWSLE